MARTVLRANLTLYIIHINTSCVPGAGHAILMTCRLNRSTRHSEPTATRA